MTARYRCCWCGSAVAKEPRTMRKHILERHRMRLIEGLGIIESFSTRKPPDPPRNAAKPHLCEHSGCTDTDLIVVCHTHMNTDYPLLNPGVSGEGDS